MPGVVHITGAHQDVCFSPLRPTEMGMATWLVLANDMYAEVSLVGEAFRPRCDFLLCSPTLADLRSHFEMVALYGGGALE